MTPSWLAEPHRVQPPTFAWLHFAMVAIVLLSLWTGYVLGRTQEVVCADGVAFHPISELHPDAYAGQYAVCGHTPVVILD